MCMDVCHNTNRAKPQVISFDNDKDIQDFSISHYAVLHHSYDHFHIKETLISQERSKIWKSCKQLVKIISRVLSNNSVCSQLNFSMHIHFNIKCVSIPLDPLVPHDAITVDWCQSVYLQWQGKLLQCVDLLAPRVVMLDWLRRL